MNNLLKLLVIGVAVLTFVTCKNQPSEESIVGHYETFDKNDDQKIAYNITHIEDNTYGIKVTASFHGAESQTDYLEGSYNPEERILTTKRSNVILNYQFSEDYMMVELLGDENDLKLERK